MQGNIKRHWRKIGLSILGMLVACYVYATWHVVSPRSISAGTTSTNMSLVELSVHKYDKDHWLRNWTTGESLIFSIPKAYFQNSARFSGGAQQLIDVSFDTRNLEPSSLHNSRGRRDADGGTGFSFNDFRVSAYVRSSEADRNPPYPAAMEGRLERYPFFFRLLDETYCGLHLVASDKDSDREWQARMLVAGEMTQVDFRETRPFPLNTAQYFLEEEPAGTIQTMISCGPGDPKCSARTDYMQRWELRVFFPANRLCEWQTFINQSREVFDRHLVETSPPRPEYR